MRPTVAILALALAACGPPPEAQRAAGQDDVGGPPPVLLPTSAFDTAIASANPDAARIEAESEVLAARAAALQARAEALSATPVIDPDARERLDAGTGP